jgi:hypothetical protein
MVVGLLISKNLIRNPRQRETLVAPCHLLKQILEQQPPVVKLVATLSLQVQPQSLVRILLQLTMLRAGHRSLLLLLSTNHLTQIRMSILLLTVSAPKALLLPL